ncbi:hypothetical protein B6I21_07725 [candidate division KSB1 bacterium 4572_119]|nr:MAG: hypothetical protein B6I21_07725 [candidate division KSB1 bacterium 4572_119]
MLDESFFMYGEDLDWCYRVGEAGWKIYYLPDTKIIHFKGESSKKSDIDLILQFYRAMNLFVGKHYQKRYFYFPQWFLLTGIWLRASLTFANKFLSRIWPGIVDFVLLNFSMLLGIYVGVYLRFDFFPWQSYLPVMLVYSIVWMGCIISTGSYFSKKFSSLRTIYGVSLGLMINTSLTFFFNQYAFSRAVVLIAGFLNILLLAGWRFNLKILARLDIFPFNHLLGHSLLGRKALIVAPIESGRKIAEKLGENYQTGYDVTGIVLPDEPGKNQETETGIPVLGTVKFLDKFIEQTRAKEVIFSIEQISFDRILEIIHHSKKQNIHFKLIPNSMDVIIGKASVEYIGDLPLVDINYRLNQSENIVIKRAFDVIFSMLAIFITLPEFLFIRIIKNEKIIKRKILTTDLNQVEILEFENQKLSRRQKRIPSLWSVLSGKISLVGSSIVYADKSNADHIDLKPGLTGMAQINKKNPEFLQDKKKYNHFYMKNYSIQLDFEIIIKTLFNI